MSTSSSFRRPGAFSEDRSTHRRRRWSGPFDREGNRALARYLREVGATPLLEQQNESAHAEALYRSRSEFAELVLQLPAEIRHSVLNGDGEGPELGDKWKLRHLDECYKRMVIQLERADDPSISRILREAGRRKEQIDAARDALVLANLRFVAHMARQMANNSATYLDLIQEGNLGLMEAVERFEHKRGHRFSTYAFWWIRKALHLAIAGKSRMIYVPAHVRERVAEVRRATTELTERTGRTPEAEELAEHLCLSVEKIHQLQALIGEPTPLETIDENGNGTGPMQSIADPESDDPLQAALDRELRHKILACLQALSPQQRDVIRMRFGIGQKNRMTLKQVGAEMQLSRERVRQIELAALRRLQETPEARSLCGKAAEH